MTKLWKVTVNNWGWDEPGTFYFKSKEEANKFRQKFPAYNPIKYAGLYPDKKATLLLREDACPY